MQFGRKPILVDGRGNPILFYHLTQYPQIPLRGLKGENPRYQAPTGAIIDRRDETAREMLVPNPPMNRAVPQDHHPLVGPASPADLFDRLSADPNPLDAPNLLGEMRVIGGGVLGVR